MQSNAGNLYHTNTGSREVTRIDLGGETLMGGDGILLDGQTLYVVRGGEGVIVPVELSVDFASGKVGEAFSDPSFARPTTIAKFGDRRLVVNSQFDRRESGESPELPFTVSAIEVPLRGIRRAIRPPPLHIYRVDGIPEEYSRKRRME